MDLEPCQTHFVVKQLMTKNSAGKWTRAEPPVNSKYGWGCAIISPHNIEKKTQIAIPQGSSMGAERPPSWAAGVKM